MLDAVIVYDKEGRLLFANAAARSLFGFEQQPGYASEDIRKRAARLSVRDACGQPLPFERWSVQQILHGETIKGEKAPDVMLQAFNGHEIILNFNGVPRKDEGEILGAICIFRDVTEQRKAEQNTNNALLSLREAHKHMDEFLGNQPIEVRLQRENSYARLLVN